MNGKRLVGKELLENVRGMYLEVPCADSVGDLCISLSEGSFGEEFAEYEDVRKACEELERVGDLQRVAPEMYRAGQALLDERGNGEYWREDGELVEPDYAE